MRSLSWATRPSAMVSDGPSSTRCPAASERKASSAPAGSAPHTAIAGSRPWAAMAVPDSSPPPLTGATTMPMAGTASSSSRVAVPWPAITRGSSKGWISTAPVSATSAATVAARASRVGSQITTPPAPSPAFVVAAPARHHDACSAIAAPRRPGPPTGTRVARRRVVAGTGVRRHAASGVALVEQEQDRVRWRPRSLKAPVAWRCSALRCTRGRRPTRRSPAEPQHRGGRHEHAAIRAAGAPARPSMVTTGRASGHSRVA